MAVGDSSLYSGESYLGIGRETTYGTYVTATAGLEFKSHGIRTTKDAKILEQVERKRTMSKQISLGKVCEGPLEANFTTDVTAMAYLFQNAFGGTVTSATATGETAGGSAFTHTFAEGSMDQTYKSLSVNLRKGPATGGKTWRYIGGRVNTLGLKAELDEPLVVSADFVFKDSTQMSDDIEAQYTATAWEPLSFVNGRLSVETSFASLTTTSFWHVQSIDFKMNNNLKTGNEARRIGSDALSVLPVGVQSYELSCQIRFDTTTAYDAMMAATKLAAEFEFQGTTLTTSSVKRGLKLQFQKVYIKDAGDPEVSGPDEVLTSTVVFNVLRDESATGYAVRAQLTNSTANYT
jgi:hypothetical protein